MSFSSAKAHMGVGPNNFHNLLPLNFIFVLKIVWATHEKNVVCHYAATQLSKSVGSAGKEQDGHVTHKSSIIPGKTIVSGKLPRPICIG